MNPTINIGEVKIDPTSYVDPNGRVFAWGGDIYRAINKEQAGFYKELIRKGFIGQLMQKGWLVGTEITDHQLEDCTLVLKHEKIKTLSYCIEWPMIMLKQAALLTLDICLELASHGLTLQDAYPWNVYYEGTRPVFVDFGSIVPVDQGILWTPYQQFCRFFLYPLYLSDAGFTSVARHALRDYLEGVSEESASKIIPLSYKIRNTGVIKRLEMPLLFDRLLSKIYGNRKKQYLKTLEYASRKCDISRSRERFFASLRKDVAGIKLNSGKGDWFDYYGKGFDFSLEPSAGWNQKQKVVHEIMKKYDPQTVLDIACNRGWYAMLAASHGRATIAFDKDEPCITQLYHESAKQGLPIQTIVMDVLNPTPSFGWRAAQFVPAHQRFASEMVFAFAIVHHLVFRQWQNFDRIFASLADFTDKWLLIEFVEPEDEKVKAMWEDRFGWYSLDNFLGAMNKKFEIVGRYDSYPSTRKLFLGRKRDGL